MTRYVIIGAGAAGATLAAQLQDAGFRVTVVARGANLAALRADGLRYIRPDGDRRVVLDVIAGPADITLDAADILVVATKAQDAESVIQQWAWQPVTPTGAAAADVIPILVLQNGLDTGRSALRRFATVIDAVLLLPSSHVRPGEVISPGDPIVGVFYLGGIPWNADSNLSARVASDLRQAGFGAQVLDDVAGWKAGKLLGNLAHNLDALYAPSTLRDVAAAALQEEARKVLAADGIVPVDIATGGSLKLTIRPIPGYARGGSSTWQSLARAGGVESDFLYGEVVLRARLAGIEAPLNAAAQRRLARLARDGGEPGRLDDVDLVATFPSLVASPQPADVLIDAMHLSDELASADAPVLLDVRWSLGDPAGHDHYLEAHIPGAVFVDLDAELAAPPVPLAGRHPLPDIALLQESARRWGLTAGRKVVVYDNVGGMSAARAWWLLRWAGVADVRILDGAFAAWVSSGWPTETGPSQPPAGDVTLSPGHLPVLTADDAQSLPGRGILLDARAAERYRGDVEPIDSRAGHIPGAISAPTALNLGAGQRFLSSIELRDRFHDLGVTAETPVGVYCGSGVTAAHQVAALASAGIAAALYPGSWSAWSADPERQVATGPDAAASVAATVRAQQKEDS